MQGFVLIYSIDLNTLRQLNQHQEQQMFTCTWCLRLCFICNVSFSLLVKEPGVTCFKTSCEPFIAVFTSDMETCSKHSFLFFNARLSTFVEQSGLSFKKPLTICFFTIHFCTINCNEIQWVMNYATWCIAIFSMHCHQMYV